MYESKEVEMFLKADAKVEGPKITEPVLCSVDRWVVLNFDKNRFLSFEVCPNLKGN